MAASEPISVLAKEASAPRYAETFRNSSESLAPDTVKILVAGYKVFNSRNASMPSRSGMTMSRMMASTAQARIVDRH